MRCRRCGALAGHEHHVVGRALDPATLPLCDDCHEGASGVHSRLRGFGYDSPGDEVAELGSFGPVELGLRRLAVLLDFLGLVPVADCISRLADRLVEVAKEVLA